MKNPLKKLWKALGPKINRPDDEEYTPEEPRRPTVNEIEGREVEIPARSTEEPLRVHYDLSVMPSTGTCGLGTFVTYLGPRERIVPLSDTEKYDEVCVTARMTPDGGLICEGCGMTVYSRVGHPKYNALDHDRRCSRGG